MQAKEALKILINDSNAGKVTVNALLMPSNNDIEYATQLYLFPKCCRVSSTIQYCIAWLPSSNRFMAVALGERSDLKYIKQVTSYTEKHKAAEEFSENHGSQHLEIDKAIDLLCGTPSNVFDKHIVAKIAEMISHTLLCISAGRPIPSGAYAMVVQAINQMIKRLPAHSKCLTTLLTMVSDYHVLTTTRSRTHYEKMIIAKYKKVLLTSRQQMLLNNEPDPPKEELERDEVASAKIRTDLQCRLVLTILALLLREYNEESEVLEAGEDYFPHLAGEPIREIVTNGLARARNLHFIEYESILDMYRLTDSGKDFAIQVMDHETKLAK